MKNFKMNSTLPYLGVAVLLLLVMSGCSNNEEISECVQWKEYGFWNGIWHGIIAPIDLIAMIWREDVSVYAPNNNGFWYAFGFMIGSGGWGFFGGDRAYKAGKKKRCKEE